MRPAPKGSCVIFSSCQVKKHLWEYMKKQMVPFLEGRNKDSLPRDCAVRSKLRMGLIILFVVENTQISLPESDLMSLCYLLTPCASSTDTLDSDLNHFLGVSQRYF
jgi:hypothetical protein